MKRYYNSEDVSAIAVTVDGDADNKSKAGWLPAGKEEQEEEGRSTEGGQAPILEESGDEMIFAFFSCDFGVCFRLKFFFPTVEVAGEAEGDVGDNVERKRLVKLNLLAA
jgi:hypothetical protein